jgi:starch synthase
MAKKPPGSKYTSGRPQAKSTATSSGSPLAQPVTGRPAGPPPPVLHTDSAAARASDPAPIEIPQEAPAELPGTIPAELPVKAPAEIPIETPMEVPVQAPELQRTAGTATPEPAPTAPAAPRAAKPVGPGAPVTPGAAASPPSRIELPAPAAAAMRVVEPAPGPEPASTPEPAPPAASPVPKATEALGFPAEPEPVPASLPEAIPEPAPEPSPHPDPPPVQQRSSLFIVQITPEMAPVAKVGGLADVVFGLSRELAIRGNHVEIILPKYDNLRYDHIFELHEVYRDLWVPWYEGAIHCTVYFGFVHDRKCFFIEPHSHDNFFNRGSVYGYKDDVMRFAFFSRAAVEFLWKAGKHPDIVHCHDWQTALVPVLLYEMFQGLGMTHPRVCLTIHNFAHQGLTGAELLRATGLHRPEYFLDYTRLRDNRYVNAVNLLKGGIVYSNFVTTVSPRYAFETKDQGQGFGLEPTLHTHHMKYGGVVNGIDYDVWNPEVDRLIPTHYGVESIEGKYANKRALRQRLMLADNHKPIVAFIGRLDPQKGLDLLRHAIFYSLERGAQFVLLGSSPDPRINDDFWGLKHMLNDSPDCHLEIGFDEELSHLIYAGADIMLVPSRFEPCGLTQLISLRYGTIPVVRSVGGLADTVFDKDYSSHPLHERNGYVFRDYDQAGLESALGRAIACYFHHPDHFRELMKNAMRTDYSWNHPGQDYLNIYDYIRDK